jgi:hypothetical protein
MNFVFTAVLSFLTVPVPAGAPPATGNHEYWLTCIEEGVAVPPIVIKVKP